MLLYIKLLLIILSLPIFKLISTVIIKEVKYIVAAQRIKRGTLKSETKIPPGGT